MDRWTDRQGHKNLNAPPDYRQREEAGVEIKNLPIYKTMTSKRNQYHSKLSMFKAVILNLSMQCIHEYPSIGSRNISFLGETEHL